MIAKIYSAIPQGYSGSLITVEGDTNQGLPCFSIVGMANKTITESRERVRSALVNSDFRFPTKKVTINLAPAELTKDGSHLDLPIAVALLVLSGQLLPTDISGFVFVGELALDGEIKPVRGIINTVEAAKLAGFSTIFIPIDNLPQATLVPDINIIGAKTLQALFLHLKGIRPLPIINHKDYIHRISTPTASVVKNTQADNNANNDSTVSLDSIIGHNFAKRALIIALAGHHNLLISGPPGSGKSLLAQAASRLLSHPSPNEQVEIAKLHSLTSLIIPTSFRRPFRNPHHTASITSIIGGGPHVTPGEISLAHRGVLFLDELPEFPRNIIEALRQPLETHSITISRVNLHATYPANFILLATMNPCPCGHLGNPHHPCTCTPTQITAYHKRISGPILDRFDLSIVMHPIPPTELSNTAPPPTILTENVVKNTITDVTDLGFKRYHSMEKHNGTLSPAEIKKFIQLTPPAQQLLLQASTKFQLSTRSYFKIIKIARTIADLDRAETVDVAHISEALSFRQKPF